MPGAGRERRTLAGRALAQAGQSDRAVAELQRAAAAFDACGALRYRESAERELGKLGRRPHRRSRPVLAIAIAANGFRRGERWAWWALLVGNTIAYGAPMVYDQIVRAVGPFELSEYLGIAVIYGSLAITAPFPGPRHARKDEAVG